jgi:hypothetical protein
MLVCADILVMYSTFQPLDKPPKGHAAYRKTRPIPQALAITILNDCHFVPADSLAVHRDKQEPGTYWLVQYSDGDALWVASHKIAATGDPKDKCVVWTPKDMQRIFWALHYCGVEEFVIYVCREKHGI